MAVTLHKKAEAELEEAVAYYGGSASGTGQRFLSAVLQTLELLATYQLIGRAINRILRRYSMRDWPYTIVYTRKDEDRLHVIAVAHEARRRNYWRSRMRKP